MRKLFIEHALIDEKKCNLNEKVSSDYIKCGQVVNNAQYIRVQCTLTLFHRLSKLTGNR